MEPKKNQLQPNIQTKRFDGRIAKVAAEVCPVCGAATLEIRGKLQCSRCKTICETCCEGGRQ